MTALKHSGLVIAAYLALGCAAKPARAPDEATKPAALPELEPRRVVTAMRGNEAALRKCFFRAPDQGGFVRVHFEVDELGVVNQVDVRESSIGNAAVEGCLKEQTAALRFGELPQAGRGEWTYVFRLAEPPTKEEHAERAKQRALRKKKPELEQEDEAEPGAELEQGPAENIDLDRVDQIVQMGYQLYARCYRDGFERNLELEGTVRVRFVIGSYGRMDRVLDGASDLSDRRVLDCIAESFYALKFPPPGEKVRILYRLRLN
jgi:hypothetical protein